MFSSTFIVHRLRELLLVTRASHKAKSWPCLSSGIPLVRCTLPRLSFCMLSVGISHTIIMLTSLHRLFEPSKVQVNPTYISYRSTMYDPDHVDIIHSKVIVSTMPTPVPNMATAPWLANVLLDPTSNTGSTSPIIHPTSTALPRVHLGVTATPPGRGPVRRECPFSDANKEGSS